MRNLLKSKSMPCRSGSLLRLLIMLSNPLSETWDLWIVLNKFSLIFFGYPQNASVKFCNEVSFFKPWLIFSIVLSVTFAHLYPNKFIQGFLMEQNNHANLRFKLCKETNLFEKISLILNSLVSVTWSYLFIS